MESLKPVGANHAADGEPMDFGSFYDAYIDKVYAYVYRKTSHKETAEDLTSQIFFKALGSFDKFDPIRSGGSAWIFAIARNSVIDYYRKRKEELPIEDFEHIASSSDPAGDFEKIENHEQASRLLDRLNQGEREVIALRLWDGLSWREIAQVIGKTEASCKMTFFRAIKRLQGTIRTLFAFISLQAINIWIK